MSFDISELDHSEWSLGSAAFNRIVDAFASRSPPARILEFGSGASTRAFATTWPEAQIVAVDHSSDYLPVLGDLPQPERVQLNVVALKHRVVCGVPTLTYDFRPPGVFDLALVDGPPRRLGNGRLGALLLAYNSLRPGGLVFLDDAYRASELKALSRLSEMTGVRPRFLDVGHGLAVLVRAADAAHVVPAVMVGAGVETIGKAVAAFVRR